MATLSKSRIDRLGERLKSAPISEHDLRLLDEYRRSFAKPYEHVVRAIRDDLLLETTGRPAKSTTSIVAKLLRESVRLTQIQDIAGCRIVVGDWNEQNAVVDLLCCAFHGATVVDRTRSPSHGYRAVHVIPRVGDKRIEIQVRTRLQHRWAEVSERLADLVGSELKYGRGPAEALEILQSNSELVCQFEEIEQRIADLKLTPGPESELRMRIAMLGRNLNDNLARLIESIESLRSDHE